jgi:hypothetical protein
LTFSKKPCLNILKKSSRLKIFFYFLCQQKLMKNIKFPFKKRLKSNLAILKKQLNRLKSDMRWHEWMTRAWSDFKRVFMIFYATFSTIGKYFFVKKFSLKNLTKYFFIKFPFNFIVEFHLNILCYKWHNFLLQFELYCTL